MATRPKRLAWVAVLVTVLGACTSTDEQTWIGVRGPTLPQELSLEIGDQAWSVTPLDGSGVVAADLSGATRVRLVGVSDCHVYASFDAEPGSRYAIRFSPSDPEVVVEQVEMLEMGPGLVERSDGVTDCD
jgi:hypothetical protein